MPVFVAMIITAIGCQSSNPASSQNNMGTISGNLPAIKGAKLLAISETEEISIPLQDDGKFISQLPAGNYKLLMQTLDGKLTLIKRSVEIENNLSVSVLDISLIPIPRVVSVKVPLTYSKSAIIEWETDIESDGTVEYGTNELYGYSAGTEAELKTNHRIQLYNLLPSTTYHFRIKASRHNLESAQSISNDYVFTTEP